MNKKYVGKFFIAKHYRVARNTIENLINKSKKLQSLGPVKFPWPESDVVFKKLLLNIKIDPRTIKNQAAIITDAKDDAMAIKSDSGDSDFGTASYFTSRAEREKWTAKMAKLNYLQKTGKLVEVEAVARDGETFCFDLQKAILLIPDRIGPLCEGCSAKDIKQKMAAELKRVLKDFALDILERPDDEKQKNKKRGKKRGQKQRQQKRNKPK